MKQAMTATSYRIVPSDPDWPGAAAEEIALVSATLGLAPSRVEHVGSTAVPGLGAKPIVDLMAGIGCPPTSEAALPILDRLRSIGYEIKGIETAPGTLYCRKAEPRRFNLHLTEHGNEFWISHLAFRDYLRAHPDVAAEYERLKRDILARMGDEISQPAYNAAKGDFIQSVTARARSV